MGYRSGQEDSNLPAPTLTMWIASNQPYLTVSGWDTRRYCTVVEDSYYRAMQKAEQRLGGKVAIMWRRNYTYYSNEQLQEVYSSRRQGIL